MDGRFRLSRATVAITIFLAVLLLAISAGSLAAADDHDNSDVSPPDFYGEDDWPMFRYDSQDWDGHKPDANPPTEDITNDWTVDIGESPSSPIAYDGKIFVTTEAGSLQARNADTGELIWEQDVGQNPTRHVAINDKVIIGQPDSEKYNGTIRAFNADTGKQEWQGFLHQRTRIVAGADENGETVFKWAQLSDNLFIKNDRYVCNENGLNGNYEIWTEGDGHGSPGGCHISEDDASDRFTTTRVGDISYEHTERPSNEPEWKYHLAAHDHTDPSYHPYNWKFELGYTPGREVSPSVAGDVVFTWADNHEHGSGLYALNRHTGETLWHQPTAEPMNGEAIVSAGNAYFTAGNQLYKISGDSSPLPKTKYPSGPSETPTSTPPTETTDAPIPTTDVPPPEPTDTPSPPTESTDAPIPTPDVPPPEPTSESGTPDNANEQVPEQTPESSITFPDATPTPTLTPSGGSDPSPVQEAADSGVSLDDSSADTADSDAATTTDQELYPDVPADSRTETPPSTANQEDVTVGPDASAAGTPVADATGNDADSDAAAPQAGSTATAADSQNKTQPDDSDPITTESTMEDQAGFGPLVALLAVVGSILLAYRRA